MLTFAPSVQKAVGFSGRRQLGPRRERMAVIWVARDNPAVAFQFGFQKWK